MATAAPLKRLPESLEQLLAEEPSALEPDRRLLLRGVVLRRKVLGRSLAFCTLKPEAHAEVGGPWNYGLPSRARLGFGSVGDLEDNGASAPSPGSGDHTRPCTIGLCFSVGLMDASGTHAAEEENAWFFGSGCSSSSGVAVTGAEEPWSPFPERGSELPVGTRLEASALLVPAYRREELVVRRWRVLPESACVEAPPSTQQAGKSSVYRDMPAHHAARNAVNQAARKELMAAGRGPALCKFWAAGRSARDRGCCSDVACEFRHCFTSAEEEARAAAAEASKQRSREKSAQEQSVYDAVQGVHEDTKAGKALRSSRFAAWLLDQYGRESLSVGSGVLDVAGGQGDLSWALSFDAGVPCTLIDPGLRRGGLLKSWQRRALRKSGKECFSHVPEEFCASLFGPPSAESCQSDAAGPDASRAAYAQLLLQSSLVVGLHPDEATEAIVDLALASGCRFAVVPCCVFANKFPDRRLPRTGEPIRTVNQFCEYLRAKDERIRETLLDFEGRNKVLYIP